MCAPPTQSWCISPAHCYVCWHCSRPLLPCAACVSATTCMPLGSTDQPKWDTWGRLFEPLLSHVPLLHTNGNHEIEPLANGDRDTSYNHRYPTPQLTGHDYNAGDAALFEVPGTVCCGLLICHVDPVCVVLCCWLGRALADDGCPPVNTCVLQHDSPTFGINCLQTENSAAFVCVLRALRVGMRKGSQHTRIDCFG
jgi:hypothetical protein